MEQVKEDVIRMIQSLPDDCTLEDIQYHLQVRAKIERGLKAIEEGDFVSQAEAENRIQEWLNGGEDGFSQLRPDELNFVRQRVDQAYLSSERGESVEGAEFLIRLRKELESRAAQAS